MPMPPYTRIDFNNRLAALRDVGLGLGLAQSQIPDKSASNSGRTYLRFINIYRVAMSLQPLPSLDYGGFVPALNVLAALTGATLRPTTITAPVVTSNATPPVVGSVLTSTNGTWNGSPSSYAYQWKRNRITNIGTSVTTYTIVSADLGGNVITCDVTATNAGGASTPATSNQISVP